MKIKTLVFDLGGILYKHSENWLVDMSRKYNIPIKELEKIFKDYNKYATSNEKSKRFWIDLKEKFDISDSWKKVRQTMLDSIILVKEIVRLIRKIRQKGYEVLFFANSHVDLTPEINKKYKITKEFDGGLFSHEHAFFKPDKRFYKKLLKITTSKPKEILFIDDTKRNLEPAAELGMHTLLFKNPLQLTKKLKEYGII